MITILSVEMYHNKELIPMWMLVACKADSEITIRFALDLVPETVEIHMAPYNPNSDTPVGELVYTFSGTEAADGLSLEPPAQDLRLTIDPEQAPDMRVATFVPGLWEDGILVGVGEVWPSWVEGTIPDPYLSKGIIQGWNGIYIDKNHAMFHVDPLAIELSANQRPVTNLQVSGTAQEGSASELGAFQNENNLIIASIETQANWSLKLSGAPKDSVPIDALAATGVLAGLVGFEGDMPVHGVCLDGMPVSVGWLDPVDELAEALERFRRGYQSGWNGFVLEEVPIGGSGLVASPACGLP